MNIFLSIFVLFLLISKHPEIKRWSLAFLKEFINMKDVYGKWKLVFPLNEVDFYVLELYFHALNSLCSPYRRLPWERIEVLSSLLFIPSALISLRKVFRKCRNPDLTIIWGKEIRLSVSDFDKCCRNVNLLSSLMSISVFGSGAVIAWPLRYYLWYLFIYEQFETQQKCFCITSSSCVQC